MEDVMKTRITLVLSLVLIMVLGACNGLSYDPALFMDDEWISKEGDTYSYVWRSMQPAGQELSQSLDIAFSGFHGKHSVWMIESAVDTIMTVEIAIASGLKGQYKVCLVYPDRQVNVLAFKAGTQRQEVLLVPGRHYVVLVGLEASGVLAMQLDAAAGAGSVSIRAIQ